MDKLVVNVTRNRREKLRTAIRQIEACVWDWVQERHSIRELSPTERLERMRANLTRFGNLTTDDRPASKRESYLPAINPSGEKEIMPRSEVWTNSLKYECLINARKFCQLGSGL